MLLTFIANAQTNKTAKTLRKPKVLKMLLSLFF